MVGVPRGTIKATVLIETLPAAFEMDEILYELREHSAGLNAGRWDYIFSSIKCFPERPEMVLPDRGDVTMTVPFMRAYTELLAATCHRRGAHAMGGMAALIPSRKDERANAKALDGVRADKEREVKQGYDGTWVAHPDLVPVAREVFERGLDGAANQLERQRDDVDVSAAELLDLASTPGQATEAGLRTNVNVGFQYISFWLGGRGAAAINSLMEDAATAEISRTQIWQWIHHRVELEDGRTVTPELVRQVLDEETARIREEVGEETWRAGRPAETRELFERVALSPELIQFLTIPAYDYLELAVRIVVTGATGLIGRALVSAAQARGDAVVALSRDERRAGEVLGSGVEVHSWPDPTAEPPPESALAGADAVVNLMGEEIAQRWTERGETADPRLSRARDALACQGMQALAERAATGHAGLAIGRRLLRRGR